MCSIVYECIFKSICNIQKELFGLCHRENSLLLRPLKWKQSHTALVIYTHGNKALPDRVVKVGIPILPHCRIPSECQSSPREAVVMTWNSMLTYPHAQLTTCKLSFCSTCIYQLAPVVGIMGSFRQNCPPLYPSTLLHSPPIECCRQTPAFLTFLYSGRLYCDVQQFFVKLGCKFL